MRPAQFLATVLAVSSLTSAWPWPESFGELKAVQNIEGMLYKRQDRTSATQTAETTAEETTAESTAASETAAASENAAASGSEAATTTEEAAAPTDSAAATTGSDETTTTGTRRATGTITGSASRTGTRTRTGSSSAETTEFDPRLPAGGISMITPAVLSGPQYYKIGEYVTFGWNYTSLEVTPSAIDILAACSANQETYTLALNQSVKPTGSIVWDTKETNDEESLLTSTYTLIIYDAESSISAAPAAGYLAPFRQFTFGMYQPQKYTPLAQFECATCLKNGGQALAVVGGMSTITVLSFLWFAGGFGVF